MLHESAAWDDLGGDVACLSALEADTTFEQPSSLNGHKPRPLDRRRQPDLLLPGDAEVDTWRPIPLGPVIDGDRSTPVPDLCCRDDGRGLFYAGAVNSTWGDSGLGKSWLIAFIIKWELGRDRHVLVLDYEDTEVTLVARLLAMSVPAELIASHVHYIRPDEPATDLVVLDLIALIHDYSVSYVAIDSIGEAFALEGINEDKDAEVGPWIRAVPRRLADAGSCVHLTDHATKAADNPLHASGSKRKRAAITGAGYLVEAIKPLVRAEGSTQREGRLRHTCAKDRHGAYARGEHVATFELTSWPDGGVTTKLWQPLPSEKKSNELPTILAAKAAIKAAKSHGEPVSQRALEGLMEIKAAALTKRGGIEFAASGGFLTVTAGPRSALLYTWAKDMDSPNE